MKSSDGLLHAHPPRADGLSWDEEFAPADHPRWRWLHYDLAHAGARNAIEADTSLPAFARRVLTSLDETPRLIAEGKLAGGVLPSFARTGDADEYTVVFWHFVMLPDRLITARRTSTRTLVRLWESAQAGHNAAEPATLVALGIADFARDARRRLKLLDDGLDALEDALLERRDTSRLVELSSSAGTSRREAVQLKRVLAPLARVMEEDEEEDTPAWEHSAEHDAAQRAVLAALDEIAALQDRSRSLQEELNTRLAEETNRRLYTVSVVTTLVAPATLITGFFSINTSGLIWSGEASSHGSLYVLLLCLAAVVGVFLLLKRRKLI